MVANACWNPSAGASGRRVGLRAQALLVGVSVFIITGLCLGVTAGALAGAGLSLLGVGDAASLAAAFLAAAASLPVAGWLGWRSYRLEATGEVDKAAEHLGPAGRGGREP
ncbi:hypothetical protein SAMN06265365_11246 [Tistlia consotensis]|uniref:Uncharacterized protein n=1 Tax=Tistlia consotensis USBA 355 TaxID=560819 RepID=A0A1Y6BZ90_9PROT|nr:hypothetical protein [Tistlia consotensis]SMF36093.1 hypothetical protein SAMN05428998_11246 [Tistlia consotensis USBA 355]SNR71412.1 hypothetical protein SAMN06265365_11246 [Tistlia consotensis]